MEREARILRSVTLGLLAGLVPAALAGEPPVTLRYDTVVGTVHYRNAEQSEERREGSDLTALVFRVRRSQTWEDRFEEASAVARKGTRTVIASELALGAGDDLQELPVEAPPPSEWAVPRRSFRLVGPGVPSEAVGDLAIPVLPERPVVPGEVWERRIEPSSEFPYTVVLRHRFRGTLEIDGRLVHQIDLRGTSSGVDAGTGARYRLRLASRLRLDHRTGEIVELRAEILTRSEIPGRDDSRTRTRLRRRLERIPPPAVAPAPGTEVSAQSPGKDSPNPLASFLRPDAGLLD